MVVTVVEIMCDIVKKRTGEGGEGQTNIETLSVNGCFQAERGDGLVKWILLTPISMHG